MANKIQTYAVVDIETTGGRASRSRITEIAIVLTDGHTILDRWSSLINPECYIPAGIVELTGITQEMVADAPKFYEIARKVVEMTEGAIFVAHNVRFDYSFIREEFRRLSFTYTRKQLCTVRLSRQAFPGLPSYSLGKLCHNLGISNQARHRAMGDAAATTELLHRILSSESQEKEARDLINLGIKEALLPQNISLEVIHNLPEEPGVYYFHDPKGDVVYIGKSINIKKRVAQHFAQKTEKARKLQKYVHDITFTLCGNELVALLLESHEIKRLRPPINRAQKVRQFPYVIHHWVNDDGYICLSVDQVTAARRRQLQVLSEYPKLGHAKNALARAVDKFQLCGSLTQSHRRSGACFQFHLKHCLGACIHQENPESYNRRARSAIQRLTTIFEEDFFIIDQGRHTEEVSVVLIEHGNYCGFGFLDKDQLHGDLTSLRNAIQIYPGNPETRRLIQRYLSKPQTARLIPFESSPMTL